MPDDTMLPDDDRDLELARRLGERLAQGRPLDDEAGHDEADRVLLRDLLAFKDEQRALGPEPGASTRMWTNLEPRLKAAPPAAVRAPLRLVTGPTALRWMAAAAGVLLLAATGWLWWSTRAAEPVLLAAADADMVSVTTADGSTVTLRPHSRLYVLRETRETVRLQLDGEAFFDVAPDPARVFAVEAGGALVSVLGTRFDVSTWEGRATAYLAQGSVRFESLASGEAVVLTPGQRSSLTDDGRVLPPSPADDDEHLDWMRRELTLAQQPLRRILAELSHHYNVTLDAPAALQDETLTGRIPLTDLAQSLADLGAVLGGRFVQVDDSTYRFEAR